MRDSDGRVSEIGEVVHIGYVGGTGGDAAQTFELAAGQAASGLPVTLVVPKLPRVEEMAFPYHNLPNLRLVLSPLIQFDQISQNPGAVWKLLQTYRAPILHLHTGDIAIPRMTLLALEFLRGPKVIATVHNAYPEMPFGSFRARYWASAARRRLDRIVSPSQHGRQTQIDYGIPKVKTRCIYNGVETERFASGKGGVARRQLDVDDTTPLVISTARLHPQKRPLDAIDAFARIAKDSPDAQLVMVGTGPLLDQAKARVAAHDLSHRIHFVGHQFNIPDWLAAADIWITTSDAENFSISVIEAMAAGKAIVGTYCKGNDEIFAQEDNALTAPVGDIAGLADGILCLLRNPHLRERLGDTARATAERFSRAEMVRQYLDCYREVLA
jgi:glycosyltransferase involved in cell wall biosynthesis